MTEIIDFLLKRRSIVVRNMIEPGPSEEELDMILRASLRVPDHGKMGPWRFILLRGDAQVRFGEVVGEAYRKANPDAIDEQVEIERERFQRAPLVIAVVSRVQKEHKIPVWEQELSSGAACMNMLNASLALGFAAQWITEWPAYNADVASALGLGDNERIAGFVYVGSAANAPDERGRPELGDIVSEWTD